MCNVCAAAGEELYLHGSEESEGGEVKRERGGSAWRRSNPRKRNYSSLDNDDKNNNNSNNNDFWQNDALFSSFESIEVKEPLR